MITGNEPALPVVNQSMVFTTGETLRQKWAAQIMAALNMNNYADEPPAKLAKRAVAGADALIAELNGPKDGTA